MIDGNQKIRRSVCMASHAGFVKYPSLPGSISTGCIKSPTYKSRFCEQHSPRSCTAKPAEDEVNQSATHQPISKSGEEVVELLLDKKTTRGSTYYKVITRWYKHATDRTDHFTGNYCRLHGWEAHS